MGRWTRRIFRRSPVLGKGPKAVQRRAAAVTGCDPQAAFEALMRARRTAWIRYARGLVGEAEAEEIVCKALVRGWTVLAGENGATALDVTDAYMRRTIYNLARNHVRDRARRRALEQEHHADIIEGVFGSVLTTHDEELERERKDQLEAMLEGLSAAEAQALRLSFLEELKPHEVAERMEWTVGTAMTLRARGLRRLRKRYGGADRAG